MATSGVREWNRQRARHHALWPVLNRNGFRFVLLQLLLIAWSTVAIACPFCTSVPRTLSDDFDDAAVALLAKSQGLHQAADGSSHLQLSVLAVVKGGESFTQKVLRLPAASVSATSPQDESDPADADQLSDAGEVRNGDIVWLLGFGDQQIQWDQPLVISAAGQAYLTGLKRLPEAGVKRLEYFLPYLKHSEELIARDAYNEFADASLESIAGLSDQMDRQWVIASLRNPDVPLHHRRLCWSLLSQCGNDQDAQLFDQALARRGLDPSYQVGLDAAISCYLCLGGEAALGRVEREFLSGESAMSSDGFAAVQALRVHGTDLHVIPRPRLAAALSRMLRYPEAADLVISDLARWQDWSHVDRMVELFKRSTAQTPLLKPAVIQYLKACPGPVAKQRIEALRAIDPVTVKRVEASLLFTPGAAGVPVPPPDIEE
ncbi:hypothetical protein SV7mr_37950 [Stieleria bergensis]|uniref:Uncharacterized protein n=2 Tax=Stieleria bergensis TaxID=2528025 RepID=A0A517SZ03_9BACT|nr:hypothetical protein SV7mr_37950 [Planctomycetes bacterium SV_7m_r]